MDISIIIYIYCYIYIYLLLYIYIYYYIYLLLYISIVIYIYTYSYIYILLYIYVTIYIYILLGKLWILGHVPLLRNLRIESEKAVQSISRELVWKVYFELAQSEERAAEVSAQGMANSSMTYTVSNCRELLFRNARLSLIRSLLFCPMNLRWKIWLASSRLEIAAGHPERSRKLLCQALKESPNKSKGLIYLECGRIEEYMNNFHLARKIIIRACQESKSEWKLYLELILMECRQGRFLAALIAVKNALVVHSGAGRLWVIYIQLCHRFEFIAINHNKNITTIDTTTIPTTNNTNIANNNSLISNNNKKYDEDKDNSHISNNNNKYDEYKDKDNNSSISNSSGEKELPSLPSSHTDSEVSEHDLSHKTVNNNSNKSTGHGHINTKSNNNNIQGNNNNNNNNTEVNVNSSSNDSNKSNTTNNNTNTSSINYSNNNTDEQLIPHKDEILLNALLEVPKSGEVWCEGARCCLNPLVPTSFDLSSAQRNLNFAVQFTPQYGDTFIEYLKLECICQVLLPRVLHLMDIPFLPFIREFLSVDVESDIAKLIEDERMLQMIYNNDISTTLASTYNSTVFNTAFNTTSGINALVSDKLVPNEPTNTQPTTISTSTATINNNDNTIPTCNITPIYTREERIMKLTQLACHQLEFFNIVDSFKSVIKSSLERR